MTEMAQYADDFVRRDVNARVGALLRDLAYAQSSQQKMFGYKRAASAVLGLDEPLTDLLARHGGRLPRIAGIGPATTRIIEEVLASGWSPTVEEAVAKSDRALDIRRRRTLRAGFLSRAAVLQALVDPALGPSLRSAYRGDFQMHSEWSDGSPSLEEIAEACAARGYEYAAVTDHSHGLKIAGGMSMDDVVRQHETIDRINAQRATSCRLIKGVEANIGADGQLDLSDDEARVFELVLAAPHSKLRVTAVPHARV
jgi:hypothetical protein